MLPHQERVVAELEELNVKRALLTQFLAGEKYQTLDGAEQHRMTKQHIIMELYADVLEDRLRHFVSG